MSNVEVLVYMYKIGTYSEEKCYEIADKKNFTDAEKKALHEAIAEVKNPGIEE